MIMNNEMITVIVKAVLAILSVFITTVLVPYIKERIGNDKYNKLVEYTKYAVRCAEQLYTPEEWEKKKQYVSQYITEKANDMGIGLNEQDIDLLIEGVVNLIKH